MAKSEESGLSDHPDIATEIGLLIMGLANLDIFLVPALTRLLRGNQALATAILSPVDNITAKKDIVFGAAEARKGLDQFASDLIKLRPSVDKAIAFRNSMAHGHFGFHDGTGDLCLVSNAVNGRRGKPKYQTLSAELIAPHAQALDRVFSLIRQHAGGVKIQMKPQEPASPDKPPQANRPPKLSRKGRSSRQPHSQLQPSEE